MTQRDQVVSAFFSAAKIALLSIALSVVAYPIVAIPEHCLGGGGFGQGYESRIDDCTRIAQLAKVALKSFESTIVPLALGTLLFYTVGGFLLIVTAILLLHRRAKRAWVILSLVITYLLYSLGAIGVHFAVGDIEFEKIIIYGGYLLYDRSLITMYAVYTVCYIIAVFVLVRNERATTRSK